MSRYHVKHRLHKHHGYKHRIVICKHCTKVVKKFKIVKCCKVVRPVKVIRCTKTIVTGGKCPCGNQIDNPSFEEPLAPSWQVIIPSPPPDPTPYGERSDDDGDIHTGGWGFVFTSGAILRQIVPVTAGCCYELMFWAQGSQGNTNLTANVYFGTSELPALTIPIIGTLNASAWISYRDFTPCVPTGVTTARVDFVAGGEGRDPISLDDIIFASAGSCPRLEPNGIG